MLKSFQGVKRDTRYFIIPNRLHNKLSLAKIGSEKLSSKSGLRFVLLRKAYQLGLAQRSSAFKINHCSDWFYSERLYPTFGSLSWFWRCREHPHPLSPHLGLWRMLEVPDWGLASLLSFGYGQWFLIKSFLSKTSLSDDWI